MARQFVVVRRCLRLHQLRICSIPLTFLDSVARLEAANTSAEISHFVVNYRDAECLQRPERYCADETLSMVPIHSTLFFPRRVGKCETNGCITLNLISSGIKTRNETKKKNNGGKETEQARTECVIGFEGAVSGCLG